jgi:signal transduction histidine kinase
VIAKVTDTGRGIPEERQEDIFKPFTRLKRDEETEDGVGLGLAIASQLAEANGGRLFLKESEPDKGSCFWLVLPTEAKPR